MSSDRLPGLPDGLPGMAGALVACAAGATLAIEVGWDARISIVVALGVALVIAIAIKIGTDMRTARLIQAIANDELDADAAPERIRARLTSLQHRHIVARALRKVAHEASKHPWQGRLSAPLIVPHFQTETRSVLARLAEVLESPDELDLRGVAMAEDLVTNPMSPLFGTSDDAAEFGIRRVLFVLGAD